MVAGPHVSAVHIMYGLGQPVSRGQNTEVSTCVIRALITCLIRVYSARVAAECAPAAGKISITLCYCCRDSEARHRAQLLEKPELVSEWLQMTRNNFISRGTLDSPLSWVQLDAGAAAKLKKIWKCASTVAF